MNKSRLGIVEFYLREANYFVNDFCLEITFHSADEGRCFKTREALEMLETYAAETNYTSLGIRCRTV